VDVSIEAPVELPKTDEPAPSVARVRGVLEDIVDGRDVDPEMEKLTLRTIVAIFLEEGLLDDARIERGLANVMKRDRAPK
jgi:hypothetical protein